MNVLAKETEAAVHGTAETLPHTALSRFVDRCIAGIGAAASWLWLVLMLVIVFQVALRYVGGRGSIALEELQWHIYGVAFLIGLSWTLTTDRHVRVDVLAERMSRRTRTWIEFLGIALFLTPFCIGVIVESYNLAHRAWELGEVSAAPGGLPYRWIIKSAIPIGFSLLLLAALSRLSRCAAYLFNFPRPIWDK